MLVSLRLLAFPILTLVILGAGPDSGFSDDALRYNRDVLPILADHCFACHGFDNAKRAAGLRLDQRSGSVQRLESGARAIVPGDLAQSELWRRVTSEDLTNQMPPRETGHALSPAEKKTLRRWIEQGAEYEAHWAYVLPQKTEPPSTFQK